MRYFALIAFFAAANAAYAAEPSAPGLGIAGIVNEEAISSYDVDSRMKFIVATARLSGTPDVLARIRPQVIRSLVDERLQMQEAKKNNLVIEDKDVEAAIAGMEAQRGMPAGTLYRIMEQNRVPKETFTDQIRAQLAWNKLLLRKIRPKIHISDEEVALAQSKFAIPKVKQELKIAILSLPVDKPAREAEMRALGAKLVREVRAGASFEEVSRQFSSRASNEGGKVEAFWVKPEQLDPAIGKILTSAKSGSVTDPVRTADGFTIVKIYDARAQESTEAKETELSFKEIILKLKPDAKDKEAETLLAIGEAVAKHPGSCEEKGIAGINDVEDVDIEVNLRHALAGELPSAERIILENLKTGDISSPFASDEGIRLYMLCGSKQASPKAADKAQIQNLIYQQKMDLEAQKYLRNLRRDAYVEVR